MFAYLLVTLLAATSSLTSATLFPTTQPGDFGPSESVARQNAFAIFNAVHSAMRQWGSSLNHNGMSIFPVTIPEGVLLHHGTQSPDTPSSPEWLAFEIEHAELFAHPQSRTKPLLSPQPNQQQQQHQHPLSTVASHQPTNQTHGYLHTYRTTRPLHLLYLDGTSAGKTGMGTLDTQDLLLRLNRSTGMMDERDRARSLCELATAWSGGALDGIVRMEAGFEVIKCDFTAGMERVAVRRRPDGPRSAEGAEAVRMFEFVRAVAQRYAGIGAGRVRVDFSGMVSAFWYPVDLGNPDREHAELPRLVGLSDGELRAIRERVAEVVSERVGGAGRSVDWQGVADLVVTRYADRLKDMAELVDSVEHMQGEVNGLLDTHIDYAKEDEGHGAAVERCATFYTSSVDPATHEDRLIRIAIETVTHDICSTLFQVRRLVVDDPAADDASLRLAQQTLRGLMSRLKWTKWKECSGCGFNEVCFVPMWPFGDKDSHERPNCRNATTVRDGWWDNRYWDWPRRQKPGKDHDSGDGEDGTGE